MMSRGTVGAGFPPQAVTKVEFFGRGGGGSSWTVDRATPPVVAQNNGEQVYPTSRSAWVGRVSRRRRGSRRGLAR